MAVRDYLSPENVDAANERRFRAECIRLCQHPSPRAAGMGYALCDDCGALLPDEDPDLRAKAEQKS
jgi:hypothetical protein